MRRPVEELLETMSYEEMLDWAERYQLYPWGERRADMRAALICSVIANVNRDPKKKKEPFTPREFMMFEREVKPKDIVQPEVKAWFYAKAKKNAS